MAAGRRLIGMLSLDSPSSVPSSSREWPQKVVDIITSQVIMLRHAKCEVTIRVKSRRLKDLK